MKTRLGLLAIMSFALSTYAGDTWLFVKPLNYYYDEAKLFVLTDLLKQELQVQGAGEVKMVERPQNGPDLENDAAARKEALALTSTTIGFSSKISQMENTVFIFVYKWDSSGDLIFQDRVSVPVGEDAEALVSRLATCLIRHEKFAQTATAGTITMKDTRQPRRKNGSIMLLGRTGILYPYDNSFRVLRENGSTYNPSTGMYESTYEYDEGNTFSMEFGIGYDVNTIIVEGVMGFDGMRQLYFGLGGEYMILNHLIPNLGGEICPYIGCDLGVTLVNKADEFMTLSNGQDGDDLEKNSDGFYGGLRFGVMLFRNHNVKFMPEIRAINVFNEDWDKGIRATVGMMLSF